MTITCVMCVKQLTVLIRPIRLKFETVQPLLTVGSFFLNFPLNILTSKVSIIGAITELLE